ncbi:RNA polymerase sigma-70 factor (ECF subfamily) [Caulobacter ginsengisoli]|uniref:RNA polymerase sigma-70 factor (ECF subfamily) n=1 Tax=Caulobacter ginsengisoli TaxID=400775 RepID=A0ABU0IPT5_9CAUL|nr:RNA polymerase sigma factor [Caulobacter ginsengisoli]MDQ0464020.1 RNA polymerase sigma-70 factor (ECF subfamily) [Caulobacter ginsengisoli]
MASSKHASLHDVELAALSAAGDRPAFGELVRRHGSAVRGLLRRMGAQASLADDLAQDAFLAAFESIAEFRGEGTFSAWVRRIAARLYVKRWRKDGRLEFAQDLSDDSQAEIGSGGEGAAASRIDLDEALKGLGETERMCISLCYGAGLSHAEAAEALNAPLGTVKSHVKRGLDKLRSRLAPPEGGSGRQVGQSSGADAHG